MIPFNCHLGIYSFSNSLNFVKLYYALIFTKKVPRPKYQESFVLFFQWVEDGCLVQEPDCEAFCAVVVVLLSNDPNSLQAQTAHLPLSLLGLVFIFPSPLWFPQHKRGEFAKYSRWTFEPHNEERVDLLVDAFSISLFQEEQTSLYTVGLLGLLVLYFSLPGAFYVIDMFYYFYKIISYFRTEPVSSFLISYVS